MRRGTGAFWEACSYRTLLGKDYKDHRSDQIGGGTVAGRIIPLFLQTNPSFALIYRGDQPLATSIAI